MPVWLAGRGRERESGVGEEEKRGTTVVGVGQKLKQQAGSQAAKPQRKAMHYALNVL